VHGPLIATLLMDLLRREAAPTPTWPAFRFKAVRPTFDCHPMRQRPARRAH
jgi:3-methylfumaryl-CoA hydratase